MTSRNNDQSIVSEVGQLRMSIDDQDSLVFRWRLERTE
jgi:hypothetical protein